MNIEKTIVEVAKYRYGMFYQDLYKSIKMFVFDLLSGRSTGSEKQNLTIK